MSKDNEELASETRPFVDIETLTNQIGQGLDLLTSKAQEIGEELKELRAFRQEVGAICDKVNSDVVIFEAAELFKEVVEVMVKYRTKELEREYTESVKSNKNEQ